MQLFKIKIFNNKRFVCFSRIELDEIFIASKLPKIFAELQRRGLSQDIILKDLAKANSIADPIVKSFSEHRDEHEVFAAADIFHDFYSADSKICFELKDSFNAKHDRLNTLEQLNAWRNDIFADFGIKSPEGWRFFQLKRYRGKGKTDDLFKFILEKLESYSDLGYTNLLILIQSEGHELNVDFNKLHAKFQSERLLYKGQILIAYNENNQFSVMNEVYPQLASKRLPLK